MKHQRLVRLVALSVPFFAALPVVQAQPPVYGREAVRPNMVRGIVSRVYSSREFDIRADGVTKRVKTDSYENLRPGDYVTARGELRGGTFYANRVNRLDDNGPGNQGREGVINFRGEVVAVDGPQALRVRANDGRVYDVRTTDYLNRRISRGDFVSVEGRFDGSFVRANAHNVDLLRNDKAYGDGRTFSGVVNDVRSSRDFDLRVNDQIVRVQSDSYLNLRRGDIVDVSGELRGGTLFAQQVNRRDDNLYGDTDRDRHVDFRGEVIQVENRTSLRVRDQDGRVYTVHTDSYLDNRISRGDTVHVIGLFDGSFVQTNTDSVNLLRNDNVYDGR